MSWCTIESDPGVFTELIEKFGVKGVQVEEIWELEEDAFKRLGEVRGLIFLFKWQDDRKTEEAEGVVYETDNPEVFFANQVIQNACGTQALLHILLNNADVEIGDMLTGFKSFSSSLPPDMIGEVLRSQDDIRIAHNSFARPEPFVMEKSEPTEDDAAYHFIAYVPIGSRVYEIDGLKPGPVCLGDIPEGKVWTEAARPAIQSRMGRYSSAELGFSLMALVRNRRELSEERLAKVQARVARVNARLAELSGETGSAAADIGEEDSEFKLAESTEALAVQQGELMSEQAALEGTIASEIEKFKKWKAENIRRKHNYIPFVMELLNIMAEKNLLMPALDAGKEKAQEAYAAAVKRKQERKKLKDSEAAAASAAASGAAE